MSKKKTYKTKEKQNTVEEPTVGYNKPRITVFKSFEEENEFTHKQYALIPPLENFENVTIMVKRFYKKELKENPTLGNRIYFD